MPVRPNVTMLPMRSSNIKAAGWLANAPKPLPRKPPVPLKPGEEEAEAPEEEEEPEEKSGVLVITFLSGTTYTYADVPESIWKAFLSAPSRGKFFHKNIRMAYDYTQIG